MKNLRIAFVAAAAALLSTGAMAQAYVSADVGAGHINLDCEGVASCDNSGTAAKITGGYTFGQGFSAELGYVNFGKAKASDSGVSGSIKVDGFTVGAAYRLPAGEAFGVNFRAGIARLKTKVSGSIDGLGSASESETHTKPYFGIGIDYAITKNFKVQAGADFSKAEFYDEKASVRALTVGARYDF